MTDARLEIPLKSNAKRSVSLSPTLEDGRTVVIKRFHSPGRIDRWRDKSRARGEFKVMKALHERGLAVPAPLSVREREGGFELVTEWVPDAVTLADVVNGRAPWPPAPGLIAKRLGALLARAHASGLDHPDLHAGNVILAGGGQPFAIDFHKARLSGRSRRHPGVKLDRAIVERDLVRLAAGVRELASVRFRQRFVVAYLAALGEVFEREIVEDERAWIAALEEKARQRRREIVEKHKKRWMRASSSAKPFRIGELRGFQLARQGESLAGALDERIAAALTHDERDSPRSSSSAKKRAPHFTFRMPGEIAGFGSNALALGFARRRWRRLREDWYAAVRLNDHALRCARPIAIARGRPHAGAIAREPSHVSHNVREPKRWAVFALPSGAQPVTHCEELRGGRLRRRFLHSVGELLGALADRGLALERLAPEQIYADLEGQAWLGIGLRLRKLEQREDKTPWKRHARLARGLTRRERALCAAGFVRGQSRGCAHARAMRARICRA